MKLRVFAGVTSLVAVLVILAWWIGTGSIHRRDYAIGPADLHTCVRPDVVLGTQAI